MVADRADTLIVREATRTHPPQPQLVGTASPAP